MGALLAKPPAHEEAIELELLRLHASGDEPSTAARCFENLLKMQREYARADAELLRAAMDRKGVVAVVVNALNRWGGVSEPVAAKGCTLLATLCRDEGMLRAMRAAGMEDRARTLSRRHPDSPDVVSASAALHAALRGVWQLHS
ncbi:hypothetical protein FNF31_05016 [Cafeteria roenbergensis]|nr:hypothetical protein FNF31_05016 [Cafeteria roenbergensis]